MSPERKLEPNISTICTFLPNRCIEEEFFTAVKKDKNTTTAMQVHGPIVVRLTSIHCQLTACYRPYSVKHNVYITGTHVNTQHALMSNCKFATTNIYEFSRSNRRHTYIHT